MIQLIKKGGLRERANRSRKYQGSENTATTLQPNRYQHPIKYNQDDATQQENNLTDPITQTIK
jgi:hypothetical protein